MLIDKLNAPLGLKANLGFGIFDINKREEIIYYFFYFKFFGYFSISVNCDFQLEIVFKNKDHQKQFLSMS